MKSKTSSKILSGTVRIDQPRRARLHRLSINITPAERVGRIVMGVGAVVAGVVLLASASAILAIVLEVLLIAAGLDLVVTGAAGHCPLYQRLGFVPASPRRPQ
jgi:sulfite exporter TauE/SafE